MGVISKGVPAGGVGGKYTDFGRDFTAQAIIDAVREEAKGNINKFHEFKPEYERNLDTITFFGTTGWIASTQVNILKVLPPYTQVTYFSDGEGQLSAFLRDLPAGFSVDRITPVWVPRNEPLTGWAQDYTEGDDRVQILPLTYLGGAAKPLPNPENNFLHVLEKQMGTEIRCIPVQFGGGNVFLARNNEGELLLLIGASDYLATKASYQELGREISEEEFKAILKDAFFVDRAVIVGRRYDNGNLMRQNIKMFHIDQIMLPIADGWVAMPDIISLEPGATYDSLGEKLKKAKLDQAYQESELVKGYGISDTADAESISDPQKRERFTREHKELKRKFADITENLMADMDALPLRDDISHFRKLMEENGFSILPIKTDSKHMGRYQSYTNGIIFKDKLTGKKTMLMPFFPDTLPDYPGQQVSYKMEGLNLENKKIFESFGISVIPVEDYAFLQRGNLHCISLFAANEPLPQSCSVS